MAATLKRSRRRELVLSHSFKQELLFEVNRTENALSPFHKHPSRGAGSRTVLQDITTNRGFQNGKTTRRKPSFEHAVIGKLPSELITQIFVVGSRDDIGFPVVVSQVCSLWRTITLQTPHLWSRINLDGRTDMWRERLARSQESPLHVELRSRRQTPSSPAFPDHDDAQLCMGLVVPCIRRWRSISITFTHSSSFLANATLSPLCGPASEPALHAPVLESLSLVYPANDDTKEYVLFGSFAPNLRELTLDGIRLAWLPSLFANLVTLQYAHHGFTQGLDALNELLSILEVSNQLQSLRLSFPRHFEDTRLAVPFLASDRQPVRLHRLFHLTLVMGIGGIPSETAAIISTLSAPALRSLNLVASDVRIVSPIQSETLMRILTPFFHHQRLMRIRIADGWLHARCVLALIRTLPRLSFLSMAGRNVTDTLLDGLCGTNGNAVGAGHKSIPWGHDFTQGIRMSHPESTMPCPELVMLEMIRCDKATAYGVRRLVNTRMSIRSLASSLRTVRVRQTKQLESQLVSGCARWGVDVVQTRDGVVVKRKAR